MFEGVDPRTVDTIMGCVIFVCVILALLVCAEMLKQSIRRDMVDLRQWRQQEVQLMQQPVEIAVVQMPQQTPQQTPQQMPQQMLQQYQQPTQREEMNRIFLAGWRGHIMCDGQEAGTRSFKLQLAHHWMSGVDAEEAVMAEFPHILGPVPGWLPNAMCDKVSAHDLARWLEDNEGMTPADAQKKVMSEFPAVFGGLHESLPSDSLSAAARAIWLQNKQAEAQIQQHMELALKDPYLVGWREDMCVDGITCGARAQHLQTTHGMSKEDAARTVMSKFPQMFGPEEGWNPNGDCDGTPAYLRACFEQDAEPGKTPAEAQRKVMAMFPAAFHIPGWRPDVMCGTITADKDANIIRALTPLTKADAARRVMSQHPAMFRGQI